MTADLYQGTIDKVSELLDENKEWIQRYEGYLKAIDNRAPIYKIAGQKFQSQPNLHRYLSITKVKNKTTSRRAFYDLRYKGQSVAEMCVHIADESVFINPHTQKNSKYYEDYPSLLKAVSKKIPWLEKEAQCFRKYFASCPKRTNGKNFEHNLESQWLKQLSLRKSAGKHLINIQPIRLLGEHFQMPTPLGACKAKDGADKINPSKHHGGGIDILARHGAGKGTRLTVIELKDEYAKNEPPEKAIAQAIAYATFLGILLRTPEANPNQWWKLFGFNSDVPKKLKIKAVIAMPDNENAKTWFAKKTMCLKNPGDSLELHYIYFKVKHEKISGISRTSLSTK